MAHILEIVGAMYLLLVCEGARKRRRGTYSHGGNLNNLEEVVLSPRCSDHSFCKHLSGNCCPANDNTTLACCSGHTRRGVAGKCECAFTSGNKKSCCAKKDGSGMGTGNFCGSAYTHKTCGGEKPVCCTSRIGSICCPSGSACSASCGGGGGGSFSGGCRCVTPPVASTASDTFRLPLAKMFAHLTQASYCEPGDNLSKWECKEECAEVGLKFEPGSVRSIVHQDGKDRRASAAYVAKFQSASGGTDQGPDSPVEGDCVVAFRGSVTLMNWFRDAQINKEDPRKVLGSKFELVGHHRMKKRFKFHVGFMKNYRSLSEDQHIGGIGVVAALKKLGCGPGTGHRVYPTGQSLGAATATIAMADLKLLGFDVGLTYVFNSPRVGNKQVMKWYRTAFGRKISHFRMTNGRDPLPRLNPTGWPWFYRNTGAEFYFPVNWDERNTEYVVCDDEEDRSCSNRHTKVQILSLALAGNDHCKNVLVKNGNICDYADFCRPPGYVYR